MTKLNLQKNQNGKLKPNREQVPLYSLQQPVIEYNYPVLPWEQVLLYSLQQPVIEYNYPVLPWEQVPLYSLQTTAINNSWHFHE